MESLAGKLLVSSPRLQDGNFVRTVVLLVQHGKDGALGLVINRPTKLSVREAWEHTQDSPCQIDGVLFSGGPCEGPLMVLHTVEPASQTHVVEDVHFCAEPSHIERVIAESNGPTKFFVGYSGWGGGQLESELEEKSWLVTPATSKIVFAQGADLWTAIMRQILSSAGLGSLNPQIMPIDPSVN